MKLFHHHGVGAMGSRLGGEKIMDRLHSLGTVCGEDDFGAGRDVPEGDANFAVRRFQNRPPGLYFREGSQAARRPSARARPWRGPIKRELNF
jgi:hypothetical protein